MKKLLMLGAILALGATAMADELGKTTVPVYLQAEIVTENLIVSGIDGRDILLDFGKINKNIQDGKGRGAEAEFKVEYVGANKSTGNTINILLKNNEVDMKHTTIIGDNSMTAKLDMSDRLGTGFVNDENGVRANDIKVEDINTKGEIYRGKIIGILSAEEIKKSVEGFYEGATQLTVTLNGTKGTEIGE